MVWCRGPRSFRWSVRRNFVRIVSISLVNLFVSPQIGDNTKLTTTTCNFASKCCDTCQWLCVHINCSTYASLLYGYTCVFGANLVAWISCRRFCTCASFGKKKRSWNWMIPSWIEALVEVYALTIRLVVAVSWSWDHLLTRKQNCSQLLKNQWTRSNCDTHLLKRLRNVQNELVEIHSFRYDGHDHRCFLE